MSNARDFASRVPVDGALSNRNRIINGALQIWQRGTNFTASGYTSDRWRGTNNGTLTVSRSTDAPSGFNTSIDVNGSAYPSVEQRIEAANIYDLAGLTVTLSFRAKSISGGTTLGVELSYANSTDSFGSVTTIQSQNLTLTGGWDTYDLQYSLPASAANGLKITFFGNTGGSINFRLTGVQLEVGDTATPFEHEPYSVTLQKCQRYYQKSYQYDDMPSSGAGFASAYFAQRFNTADRYFVFSAPFKVEMRASPSISIYDRDGISNSINQYNGVTIKQSIAIISGGDHKVIARYLDNNTGSGSDSPQEFHWIADAEL